MIKLQNLWINSGINGKTLIVQLPQKYFGLYDHAVFLINF